MNGVDIPVDVISQVILYLPLKSLLRFRLVSKSWLHVIDVARSAGTLKKSAFIFFRMNLRRAYMVEGDEFGRPFNSREIIYSGQTYDSAIRYPYPAPYANGLLYLTPSNCKPPRIPNTYIYNPATQCHLELPSITITTPISKLFFILPGFGFDPTSNRFKVVQLLDYNDFDPTISSRFIQQAYILSLNPSACQNQNQNQNQIHGGSWQKLDNVPKVGLCIGSSVLVNASLHWFTISKSQILSFDLTTHKFDFIKIPKLTCKCLYARSFGLVALRGCLAIYDFNIDFDEIWMMNDYSTSKATWTQIRFSSPSRLFDIDHPSRFRLFDGNDYLPISLSNKGDHILLLYEYRILFLVNVETGNTSRFDILALLEDNWNGPRAYCVYPYTGETPYHHYTRSHCGQED